MRDVTRSCVSYNPLNRLPKQAPLKDYLLHDSFVCATRLINMREMTHWYVCMCKSNVIGFQNKRHWKTTHRMTLAFWYTSSLICVTWLIHMYDTPLHSYDHWKTSHYMTLAYVWYTSHSYVWHDACICVIISSFMCDITHPYMWQPQRRESSKHNYYIIFPRVIIKAIIIIFIHMCDMIHSYVWHDSFICVTWLMRIFVMTHLMDFRKWRHWKTTCCCRFTAAWCLLFTWRGMTHVTRMNESCHMWKRVTWHPWMSRVMWHRIPTSQPSLSKQEKRKESTNLAVGDIPGGNKNRERGAQHLKTLSCRDNWCNLNLKIMFPESRTRDFTVLSWSTCQLGQTDISWCQFGLVGKCFGLVGKCFN